MLLVANWKLNKNSSEGITWLKEFANYVKPFTQSSAVELVLAPSTVLIPVIDKGIKELNINIKLSSQDISRFAEGSHTGENSANQLKEFIQYSIIGHSERRALGETLKSDVEKARLALENGIRPIVCFSSKDDIEVLESLTDLEFFEKLQFAYEPVASIGSGNPASIESIHRIKRETKLSSFIYGGSVDEKNVKSFLQLDFIDGFLVGSASLDPEKFAGIYKNLCA